MVFFLLVVVIPDDSRESSCAGAGENEGTQDLPQCDQLQHCRLLKTSRLWQDEVLRSIVTLKYNRKTSAFIRSSTKIMDAAVRAGRPEEAWTRQQALRNVEG